MTIQNLFERYEVKYLLDAAQYQSVLAALKDRMREDEHGKSLICNVYFDTPDFRIIRRSLEKPVYKEKLRLRSYGVPTEKSTVFLELKKKYNSIVYKRREDMTLSEARTFLRGGQPDSQIMKEIEYFIKYYPALRPAVYLAYEREAFFDKTDDSLRITFDENIIWRDYDIDLGNGAYGEELLPPNVRLMEIKTGGAFPLWLTKILGDLKIYPTSFSKYGTVYEVMAERKGRKESKYA